MTYELDSTPATDAGRTDDETGTDDGTTTDNVTATDDGLATDDERGTDDGTTADADPEAETTGEADGAGQSVPDTSVGVPIPDDHAGAFVAEVFEDPELNADWDDVVDAMVADGARDAWASLSAGEQAVEVLEMAAEYDRRAVARLEAVDLDASLDSQREHVDEALRCRRNADAFRNGVADAYAADRLDDDALVGAVEEANFDTTTIAEREDLLERVDSVFDLDFRPYGGTLVETDDGPEPSADHPGSETW